MILNKLESDIIVHSSSVDALLSPVSGSKPRVWIATRVFGVLSETWLHRQVTGLKHFAPEIICWKRDNADLFPTGDIAVRIVDSELFPEEHGSRWLRRLGGLFTGNSFGASGGALKSLLALARDNSPDLILCHFGHMALRLEPVAKKLGVPLVCHFHGVDITASLRNNSWYRNSLSRCLPRLAGAVVVANYQKETLAVLGMNPKLIRVIPCGVPVTDLPERKSRQNLPKDPCAFLTVGRMVEKKAPESLIGAFHLCHKKNPNTILWMVGDGPLLDRAKALVSDLGLEDAVVFFGAQAPEAVQNLLAKASVFVQHSVTAKSGDMEGWPVSVAEAMALGLPVVATRHAGIADQVDHGKTGYLSEEFDVDGMSKYMSHLARNADLRLELGRAAAERARTQFDVANSIGRLEAFLEELTGSCR